MGAGARGSGERNFRAPGGLVGATMKRFVPILLAAAAALALLAPAVAQARRAPHSAKLVACQRSADPLARLLTVRASLRAIHGSKRLGLRFDLYGRSGAGGFRRVAGAGLGVWTYSDRGVGGYVVRKTVNNLPTPAIYRMVVRFRWVGAHGRVLRSAQRITGRCAQGDLRPDLAVMGIAVKPGARTGVFRYTAVVRNVGRGGSGPTTVSLESGGVALVTKRLPALAPGSRYVVRFSGPACDPSSPPRVVADPSGLLVDSNRANNTLAATCPAS